MFGSFSERALLAYAEKVKKVLAKQGTEWADEGGVGEEDHSYIDTNESQDPANYVEFYDFTTCLRSNGSRYGIAPGKKCRKGTEIKTVTKEEKSREGLRRRVQMAIEKDLTIEWLRKERARRRNAVKQREAFVKENRYPAANEEMRKEIERIQKEIAALTKNLQRQKRQIAKQIADGEVKESRLQRAGRLAATKARAEKVLADLKKERPETDTDRSARQGVLNRSMWD